MNFLWDLLRSPWVWIASIPRLLAALSLAGRIAACVAVFQVLVVLLATLVVIVGDDQQVIEAWRRWDRLAVLAFLLVLTPFLVYQAAKLWLEREASRYPDILSAWRAALAELNRQGISLTDVPLFLVVGSASDDEEQRLLAEAPCEFIVSAAPQGSSALHVYGGEDAVFVSLATCSRLSDLARRGDQRRIPSPAGAQRPGDRGRQGAPADPFKTTDLGTLMAAAEAKPLADAPPPVAATASRAPVGAANATIDVSQMLPRMLPAEPGITPDTTGAALQPQSAASRDEMRQRLTYFLDLLRRDRAGLVPLNGVLAVIPGGRLLGGTADAAAMGLALGDDLATVSSRTGARAPVVTVVIGLESEPGFCELIRRMPESERSGRLGHRFPVGVVASEDEASSLARRACGMVEDLVSGRLFRAPDVLAAPGNDRLAVLLVKLRSELADRLAGVLRRAMLAPGGAAHDSAPFLAGCYLAACGTRDGERGFAQGVIARLLDNCGDLEWTLDAIAADERAGGVARVLWGVSGVVLAVVAAAIAWRMWAGG
jgi:hypothetical protein